MQRVAHICFKAYYLCNAYLKSAFTHATRYSYLPGSILWRSQ
jgi:hypothetical protein